MFASFVEIRFLRQAPAQCVGDHARRETPVVKRSFRGNDAARVSKTALRSAKLMYR